MFNEKETILLNSILKIYLKDNSAYFKAKDEVATFLQLQR